MAVIPKDDSITSKLRGKVGDLLFRQYADKTVVSQMPMITTKKKSIVQQFRLHHFRKAVRYAKSVLRDPAMRAQMEGRVPPGKRLYNYLVKLYCDTNPLIDEIDDNGPVQGVCQFVRHKLVVSPESLVVSKYKMQSVGAPSSLLMRQADNLSKGERLLNCGKDGLDAMVKVVMEEMRKRA